MKGLFAQITRIFGRIVLDTPKSLGEATWRFTAMSAVTAVLVSAVLLWRYPKVVQRIALGGSVEEQLVDDIFRRNPLIREEAMELIGSYISRFKPDQFALINWTTQTGILEVWANEPSTDWPTATSGVMSRNMQQAVGAMIFDQCWLGELPYGATHRHARVVEFTAQPWLICGLSDSHDLWSYIIVHWDHHAPPEEALIELERLSRHLERILFK